MTRDSQTSMSMLHGMRNRDAAQWERFVAVYSPLINEWCRRARISHSDASDIAQEVFRVVAVKVSDFRRDQPGDTFHGWLWGITRFKVLEHFKKLAKTQTGKGGSSGQQKINQIPDDVPESWEGDLQASDTRSVYNRILDLLKTDFQPNTWQAFLKTTVDEVPVSEVAAELEMTVGAVYNARHKVLRRLREEFIDMFEISSQKTV